MVAGWLISYFQAKKYSVSRREGEVWSENYESL
jgi:hypothetical protein